MASYIGGERSLQVDVQADGAGEDVAGVKNDTGTGSSTALWKGIRVRGGGQALAMEKINIDSSEQANTLTQPAPLLSHFVPNGTVDVIPSPYDLGLTFGTEARTAGLVTRSLLRFLLDAVTQRTAGALESYTFQEILKTGTTGIMTGEYVGCKVGSLTLGFSAGSLLDVGAEIRGLSGGRLTTARTTGPTFPSSREWIIANSAVKIGALLATTTSTDVTMESLSVTIANTLTDGPPCIFRPASTDSGEPENESTRPGISETLEGEILVTLTFTIRHQDASWHDRFLESDNTDDVGSLRLLAYHADSSEFTTGSGFSTTADATITLVEDATAPVWEVGDVAYMEDSTATDRETWKREVLAIEAVSLAGGAGTDTIDIDTDSDVDSHSVGQNQAFAGTPATRIFNRGFEFKIPEFKVTDWGLSGGATDKVVQTITARAQIPAALAFTMDDASTEIPYGYLVR